jgi:hypothetical protein
MKGAGKVLGIWHRDLLRTQRKRGRLLYDADVESGLVTVVQRFGADLRLNVHFHALVLDGAYSFDKNNGRRFYPLPAPRDDDVLGLLQRVSQKIEKLARKHSNAQDTKSLPDGQGELYAAATEGKERKWNASGPKCGQGPVQE